MHEFHAHPHRRDGPRSRRDRFSGHPGSYLGLWGQAPRPALTPPAGQCRQALPRAGCASAPPTAAAHAAAHASQPNQRRHHPGQLMRDGLTHAPRTPTGVARRRPTAGPMAHTRRPARSPPTPTHTQRRPSSLPPSFLHAAALTLVSVRASPRSRQLSCCHHGYTSALLSPSRCTAPRPAPRHSKARRDFAARSAPGLIGAPRHAARGIMRVRLSACFSAYFSLHPQRRPVRGDPAGLTHHSRSGEGRPPLAVGGPQAALTLHEFGPGRGGRPRTLGPLRSSLGAAPRPKRGYS